MQASNVDNNAYSAGMGYDEIAASSTASLGSANFLLADNVAGTALSVAATGVESESNSSLVPGINEGSLTGEVSFDSLTVSGALVGGKPLTFYGDASPDTVLYKSSTVTITLDEQTLLYPPGGARETIVTDAIDIRLNNAYFDGNTISGNFDIGHSSASHALNPYAPTHV